MEISLNLQAEVERGLLARAQAKGISLSEYVQEIVLQEASLSAGTYGRTGQEFLDIGARVRGLSTDEEVDNWRRKTWSTTANMHIS